MSNDIDIFLSCFSLVDLWFVPPAMIFDWINHFELELELELYNPNPQTYVVFLITLGTHVWSRVTKIMIWISNYIHYTDVIMTMMVSQITSLAVVYSTVYSDANQRKHQSSASLALVWGIHRDRWIPRTQSQLRGKYFHLMTSSCHSFIWGVIIHRWLDFNDDLTKSPLKLAIISHYSWFSYPMLVKEGTGLKQSEVYGKSKDFILLTWSSFGFTLSLTHPNIQVLEAQCLVFIT